MLRHLESFENFGFINENIEIQKVDPITYENITVTSLPYRSLLKENRIEFQKKLVAIGKDLGIKPIWLMHTMFHESRLDPKKADKVTKAAGLLSFLPQVYRNFVDESGKNLTQKEILNMSHVEQLDLVYSFYKTWIEAMGLGDELLVGDFGAITFYPAIIKKNGTWKFPEDVIEINKDMFEEFGEDGVITKDSYYAYLEKILNSDKEHSDTNDSLLGQFSGAIADPQTYLKKKPLEYYLETIMDIHNPFSDDSIQQQDIESTEKHKQMPNYDPDQLF